MVTQHDQLKSISTPAHPIPLVIETVLLNNYSYQILRIGHARPSTPGNLNMRRFKFFAPLAAKATGSTPTRKPAITSRKLNIATKSKRTMPRHIYRDAGPAYCDICAPTLERIADPTTPACSYPTKKNWHAAQHFASSSADRECRRRDGAGNNTRSRYTH